jgi:hypothetical protein
MRGIKNLLYTLFSVWDTRTFSFPSCPTLSSLPLFLLVPSFLPLFFLSYSLFYPSFIPLLPPFYPSFIPFLLPFYPSFIPRLLPFYPSFITLLSLFYLSFISLFSFFYPSFIPLLSLFFFPLSKFRRQNRRQPRRKRSGQNTTYFSWNRSSLARQ